MYAKPLRYSPLSLRRGELYPYPRICVNAWENFPGLEEEMSLKMVSLGYDGKGEEWGRCSEAFLVNWRYRDDSQFW